MFFIVLFSPFQNIPSSISTPRISLSSAPIINYQPSRVSAPGRSGSVLEEMTTSIRHQSQPGHLERPGFITTTNTYRSRSDGASAISHSGPRVTRPINSDVSNSLVISPPSASIVPADCMQCLCNASSKCNLTKGCDGAYCGAFLLSWGYWADGGSPGAGEGLDYPSCARERSCAERAVHGYMGKWQRDCNGDGRVDCIDFALIHKLGPHACGRLPALESSDYWRQFTECRQSTTSSIAENSDEIETSENIRSDPHERSVITSSSTNTLVDRSQPISLPAAIAAQPSNINSNIISRTPYINRPAAIVNAGRQLQAAPQSRPARLNDIYESARSNSFPTVESVPDQLAPSSSPPSIIIEEINNEPIAPKPQPPTSGLTEVVVSTPAPTPLERTRPVIANNNSSSSGVTKECLECICHASSRCSNSIGCVNNGRGKQNCGPYQVDWEYWTEAGKPGTRPDLSSGENFQVCLNNRECADQTVRAFLARFQRDCNDDGVIDCNDFAAVHVAGPRACNAQWYTESKYYSDFRECYDF